MERLVTFRKESVEGDKTPRLGVVLSILFHVIIFAGIFLAFNRAISSEIVAAGPGEGGEGAAVRLKSVWRTSRPYSDSQSLNRFPTSATQMTLSTIRELKPLGDRM